jgi:hypothetical protein
MSLNILILFTNFVQAQLFSSNSAVPALNTKGPFSFTAPYNDEHPGPPFNHNTTGVLA